MNTTERMLATQELYTRLMDYWYDVDTNWGRKAGQFYTEDAVFEGTAASYRGRAKIEQFYAWRLKRGPRVAVHVVNNFRAVFQDDTHATCTWFLTLYAADGKPVLPTHPPIQIAHITDTCIKGEDGQWRYSYRKFENLFEGGTPTTNPNLDDK